MPFGPFDDWEACMAHMTDKQGYDEETAKKVCGRMKADLEVASAAIETVKNSQDRLFLTGYLMDTSTNKNKWGVKNREHLLRHIYRFAGKPIVITPDLHHPKLGGMRLIEALSAQERLRVGNILEVRPVVKVGEAGYNEDRFKINYEITHPVVKKLWQEGKLPPYLSPAIGKFNKEEPDDEITDFEPLHVAIVKRPAFGFDRALVTGDCVGDAEHCMMQLRQAAIDPPSDCLPCGKKIEDIGLEYFRAEYGDLINYKETGSSLEQKDQTNSSVNNLADNANKDSPKDESKDTNSPPTSTKSAPSQSDIDQAARMQVMEAELAKLKEKLGVTTEQLNKEVQARTAAEKTIKESKEAERKKGVMEIVTADVEPDEEKRNQRIEQLVASPWTLEEIEDIFAPVKQAVEVKIAATERQESNSNKKTDGAKGKDYNAKLPIKNAGVEEQKSTSTNSFDNRPSWMRVRDTVIRPSQNRRSF